MRTHRVATRQGIPGALRAPSGPELIYYVTLHKEGEDGRLYWAGLQEEDEDLQALPFLGHVVWVEWMRSKKSTTSEEDGAEFCTSAEGNSGERGKMKYWTNYPFTALGDEFGVRPPPFENAHSSGMTRINWP